MRQTPPERNLGEELTRSLKLQNRDTAMITETFYAGVWEKLIRFGETSAIMPSTGILALEMLLHSGLFERCQTYVVGFTHEGWKGHPWALEQKLFNEYIQQGRIIPLDKSGVETGTAGQINGGHRSNEPIQELFFVSSLRLSALDRIRKTYPHSRVVYWDTRELDEVAIRHASAMARHIIAEDALVATLRVITGRPVTPFTRFNSAIARRPKQRTLAPRLGTLSPFSTRRGPILFCPFNDTHVRTFAPISRHLRQSRFLLSGDAPGEGAEETLKALKLDYVRGTPSDITKLKPSALILAKDWSPAAEALMAVARAREIPVACVQEGPTEFARGRRMQRCDYPLVQGAIMLKHFEQRIYFLAGNARFDDLQPLPRPATPLVMLNCNFWEDAPERIRWLEAAASACRNAGVEFFASRHPRDKGDIPELPARRSGPDLIHRQLADCSVVITPHSSIIYEALLMGRTVICHDPRRSRIDAFDHDTTGAFITTKNGEDLAAALQKALLPSSAEQRARVDLFLDQHCGSRDGKTARRCASALAAIAEMSSPGKLRAAYLSLLRHPATRKASSALRQLNFRRQHN